MVILNHFRSVPYDYLFAEEWGHEVLICLGIVQYQNGYHAPEEAELGQLVVKTLFDLGHLMNINGQNGVQDFDPIGSYRFKA
jgi:hypothetical protein